MGSNCSCKKKGTRVTVQPADEQHRQDTTEPAFQPQEKIGEWRTLSSQQASSESPPHLQRTEILKAIRSNIENGDKAGLAQNLQKLRAICGLEEEQQSERIAVIIDDAGARLLLSLTRLFNATPPGWKTEAKQICDKLIAHFSPPFRRSPPPQSTLKPKTSSATHLDYSGITFRDKGEFFDALKLIAKHAKLQALDLDFTELNDSQARLVITRLAKLKQLEFLGLSGNLLTKATARHLYELMKQPHKFKKLKWVDLRNNVDIFTIPRNMLNLFQSHWPKDNPPDIHDLEELYH